MIYVFGLDEFKIMNNTQEYNVSSVLITPIQHIKIRKPGSCKLNETILRKTVDIQFISHWLDITL